MKKMLALGFLMIPFVLQAKEPAPGGQAGKLEVPTAADQKKAESEIRDVFKEDFAKKDRDGKRSLAQKLLVQAADPKNTSASRYAALFMSRDLATESLDIETVFSAVEQLEKFYDVGKPPLSGATFTINTNGLKIVALNAARKFATAQVDMVALAEAYLRVASDALREKAYEDVAPAAQIADQYAKSSKVTTISSRAAQLMKEAGELKKEDEQFGKIITARLDDPAAKLVKGRYSLFVIGDDNTGIENLLGCSEEGLKNVAKLENAKPTEIDQKVEIGEAWFSLSKKEENPLHKHRYQLRARYWFDEALKDAGGIAKAKIEKKKAELDKVLMASGVRSNEPAQTGLVGRWLFEEGTGERTSDSSGKGNHGKLGGGIKWANRAVSFDGSSGYVTLGNSGLPAPNAPQTIAWAQCVTSNPPAPFTTIICLSDESQLNLTIGYQRGKLVIWKWGGVVLASSDPASTGDWHYYAYVFDGKTHKFFIDGALKDSSTVAPQTGVYKTFELGRWRNPADPQWFCGNLSELRIYTRALSESEVKALVQKLP